VTKYLFIDGGFIERMIPKTEAYFGSELSSNVFDYRAIAGPFQRTFYYDALPEKKPEEEDAVFEGKRAARIKLFDLVNRTPFMHTREGITRNRSSRRTLEQKGVDILLAIDVFKHATLRNMSEAHVMTCDLDFFPLFEALRDTPVSVHLHCYVDETSQELMSLADVVVPITPFTILGWLREKGRDDYVEWNVPFNNVSPVNLIKEGVYEGLPFHLFEERSLGERPFLGRAMAHNPGSAMRSTRWEYIVADFESRVQKRVYFDT
jgi:uncharacterized LabA/DUF88 family protein